MASLVASVPLPLPLDSLLASSWTWLALSLATIATLLRALKRISFYCHRRPALLPPPTSIFSADAEQIPSIISDFSLPLQKTHKRRTSSRSTPTLHALVQSHTGHHGGLAYPDLGFPSCVASCESALQCLRKVASTSDIRILCGRTDGVRNSACSSDCTLNVGCRLGFLVDGQERISRVLTQGSFDQEIGEMHTATCMSPQKPLLNTPPPPSNVPPFFETQFGWCELLGTKFGLQWEVRTSALSFKPVIRRSLKSWSVQERNLFEVFNLEGTCVGAMDANITAGLVCIAQTNGALYLWDIMSQACLSRVSCGVHSVSALCWSAESRLAIAGNCNGLELWDVRTSNLISIWNGNAYSEAHEKLQCEANKVCISGSNGMYQFCDLRKLQVNCFSKGATLAPVVQSRAESEWSLALWEKLSCCDEEETSWDVEPVSANDVVASYKSCCSSFTSRCVTLVRSLSSSGR